MVPVCTFLSIKRRFIARFIKMTPQNDEILLYGVPVCNEMEHGVKLRYLECNGVAFPAFIASGTGIKCPVITSKTNAYTGILDGTSG